MDCSIIKQIKSAEESIKSCYDRVDALEKKLETKNLPADQKKMIENELQEVRKLLATNEEHLSHLHGQNRKSFAIAASLFFVCFLLYGVYLMIFGHTL